MAKKQSNLADSNNSMVQDLRTFNWLYNPVVYSQISGDFTLMQQRILIGIVQRLQQKIIDSVAVQSKTKKFPDIFDDSELMNENTIELLIPADELGIIPEHYNRLEDAATTLASIKIKYPMFDGRGQVRKYVVANLFPRIEIHRPEVSRRSGLLRIVMLTENIRDIFTMQYGYVTHLSHIAAISNKKRTPRLYIYLSRYRDIGHKRVPYNDLIEFLGLTDEYYKADKDASLVNPYTTWSKVNSLVIKQVAEEMKMLSDSGEIDFYFEYEPIFAAGKKRGIPLEVEFTIIKGNLGVSRDIDKLRIANEQRISNLIIEIYPQLSLRAIGKLCEDFTDEALRDFEIYATQVMPSVISQKQPRNPSAYAMTLLKGWHKAHTTQQAELQKELSFDIIPNKMEDLLSKLASEFGNGQQGFEYYFGKNCQCIIEDGVVRIQVPKSTKDAITNSSIVMNKINRCVVDVVGNGMQIKID